MPMLRNPRFAVILFCCSIVLIGTFIPDKNSLAAEKIKTTEYFVGDSESQINGNIDLPFSIYIGDDLSGITDPVKSVYFTLSGVYTGVGSLNIKIDNDSNTLKAFSLPDVITPTNFEIVYKDDSGKINPDSAGSYSYILNVNSSGLTISGLGVKIAESHRYKPPACGISYPVFGDLTSTIFDTGSADGPAYNSIIWKGQLGGPAQDQGKVIMQLAASENPDGPWNFYGTSCIGGPTDWFEMDSDTPLRTACLEFNNKRYFKYKLRLCSADCLVAGSFTPQVDDVVVNWSP